MKANTLDPKKISPEADFLTFCCREEALGDWDGINRRTLMVRRWDYVRKLWQMHGIAPLLLSLLKRLPEKDSMPDWVFSQLQADAMYNAARVLRLRAALTEILTSLDRNGVRVVVLKGAGLAALVYGNPVLRPSEDIDLLCRERDFEQVHRGLASIGYQTDEGPTLPHRHSREETYFERHFYHPDGLVHVELHVDSIKLGVKPSHSESIWNRARPIEVGRASTLALAPHDQVLMLSVHLHRHGFNRLIWFKDIDLVVRNYRDELDWESLVAEAKAEGAASSLWYTFRLLRKMLDTPFPDGVIPQLKPTPAISWTLARIWPELRVLNLQSVTKRRAVQFSVLESWRGMLPSLLLMGRRREKMGILVRRLLPF